jgi:hypothetical protein
MLSLNIFDAEANEDRETVRNAIALLDHLLAEAEQVRAYRRRLERFGGPRAPAPGSVSMATRFERARALDIVKTIEQLTGPRFYPAGHDEQKCVCPFPDHEDRDPSFFANPAKGVFHCFGCGRAGDVIEFARHWFSALHRVEALEQLEHTLGLREGGA